MIVQSLVGGFYELPEIGVTFQPGETLDLEFYATREVLATSRQLRSAIEKNRLKVLSNPASLPSNFRVVLSDTPVGTLPEKSSVRKAIFTTKRSGTKPTSYQGYALCDIAIRRATVTRTKDIRLLEDIVANETDANIGATAKAKLYLLRRA